MTENTDDVYQKQMQDKRHEERNSDIMIDQMIGRSSEREPFPVEENDRHEVNVHSKNDKNILTKLQETSTSADAMAPNFKVTHQIPTIQTAQKKQHVPVIQRVQKTVDAPQVPDSVRNMDVPVIKKQQVLTIQKTFQKSISELDECGSKATETRQKQHANSDDATELIKLAVINQVEQIPCVQVAQRRTEG